MSLTKASCHCLYYLRIWGLYRKLQSSVLLSIGWRHLSFAMKFWEQDSGLHRNFVAVNTP